MVLLPVSGPMLPMHHLYKHFAQAGLLDVIEFGDLLVVLID